MHGRSKERVMSLESGNKKRNKSMRIILICFLLLTAFCLQGTVVHAERIKDVARFEGVRDNQLLGYGIIVGLDGTGDKGNAAAISIINMLTRMGITVSSSDLSTKSIAAVVVTSTLPPFAKPGMKIDALVSTIGDAKNLQGGTLLLTPLKGPDGKVYGLAQGPISIGGFSAEGDAASVQKNHPTAGKIPEGITIEREPVFSLGNGNDIRLFLKKADFATADEISKKINIALKGRYASTIDPSAVRLVIPVDYKSNVVGLIARVDTLDVKIDMPAKIVINERTGTVVIGENVRISPVAIAHGSLAIEINEKSLVSQPRPFAPIGAETKVVPRTGIAVTEQKSSLVPVSGVTLGDVIKALNVLGVTPRDLISILQALKSAGALQAELEII
jgi:flagellar P-ring protein precursor FlgI